METHKKTVPSPSQVSTPATVNMRNEVKKGNFSRDSRSGMFISKPDRTSQSKK